MNKQITVSLCISTYNWPQALELCLLSVLQQTLMPIEIIIGDDGSTPQTKEVIDTMRSRFTIPLIHIWHEDDGFRLAQIRNKSFAKSSGDYIIQVDGDVIMNRFFIEDHVRFARKNCFIAGTRSLLTEPASEKILQTKNVIDVTSAKLEKSYNAKRMLPMAYVVYLFQSGVSQAKYVLGANMAFWKTDLLKINGYNESYKGWGKEDNDLSIRLCNAGVSLHFVRFAAVIYHLHHTEASRNKMAYNQQLLTEAIRNKQAYISEGMNKYL